MSLRAVVGVRAARYSNGFFSHRSQKHLSDMANNYLQRGRDISIFILSHRLCNTYDKPARSVRISIEPQLGPCQLPYLPMPVPPSFSSFPPSFSSFPDLGGSSRKEQETESSITVPAQKRDSKDRDKEGDRKKERRDKRSGLDQITSRKRKKGRRDTQGNARAFDDERLKAEEDVARRTRRQEVSQPTFFSDKKGDPMSMQYGGNYSKDIPKYHLFGRGLQLALLYDY
jgi:hypothetical protein